ncbi:MAG: phosphatidylglycerophosphatase A [Paracoccaceae bacterium]
MARMIATVAGVGLLPRAPGTWGSLVALPLAWLVHSVGLVTIGGFALLALASAGAFAKGLWAVERLHGDGTDPDKPEYVIDEVAGQWIALLPVAYGAQFAGVAFTALWPGWLAAFGLFRLFDIWKPWIIGQADRRGDSLGVMLDDVLAGIFAALGVMVLAVFAHLPVLL